MRKQIQQHAQTNPTACANKSNSMREKSDSMREGGGQVHLRGGGMNEC
jgi:hypothetical protein